MQPPPMANGNFMSTEPPYAEPPSSDRPRPPGVRHILPTMFRSLRHRNYRLFYFGHMTSMAGNWMQQPAMQWLVVDMTGSAGLLGVLGAVRSLPITLFGALGGLVTQRLSPRRLLLVTQVLLILTPAALAVTMFIDYRLIFAWHLMLAAAVHGTIMAFDIPARQSFVVKLVGHADLPNAIALNSSTFNISRTIGPAVGGAIMATLGLMHGAAVCFAVNALTYVALIGALTKMRLPDTDRLRRQRNRSSHHPFGGFHYIWSSRPLRAACVLLMANSLFGWPLIIMLAVFTRNVFHRDVAEFGGLVSVYGAGSLVGALILAYLSGYRNRQRLILVGIGLFIASGAVFTFVGHYLLAMIPLFTAGIGMMTTSAGINSYIQMTVSERFRGRVMGVYAMFFAGMMPFGFILTGWLADQWSLVGIIRVNIAVLAAVAAGVAVYWRRLRTANRAPQAAGL